MSTPRLIVCTGAKGGQGTTTIAAAIALTLARDAWTVLIDTAGDALPILGCPGPCTHRTLTDAVAHPVTVTRWLDVATTTAPIDRQALDAARERGWHVVIDAGTTPVDVDDAERVLVVRNCYLALRRVVWQPQRPDVAAVVIEPDWPLTATDVADILPDVPKVVVAWDPKVAGIIDAGLLAARYPDALADAAAELVDIEVHT